MARGPSAGILIQPLMLFPYSRLLGALLGCAVSIFHAPALAQALESAPSSASPSPSPTLWRPRTCHYARDAGDARVIVCEPAPGPPSPLPQMTTVESPPWYGYQTLLADVVSVGATLGGARSAGIDGLLVFRKGKPGQIVMALGFGTFMVGAPVIHLAHGGPLKAAASLGLRLGLVAPSLALVLATTQLGELIVASTVLFAAAGVASGVDAAVIARESLPRAPAPARATAFQVTPTFQLGPTQKAIGLRGTF